MYDSQIWEATPGQTLLHRLDARVKLCFLGCCALFVIVVESGKSLFCLFSFILCLHGAARMSLERWKLLSLFVLLGMWGTMMSQALFYNQEPRTILACLVPPVTPLVGVLTGGVFVYREGLEYGAVQALRSGSMMAAGLLLVWTSDSRSLLRSLMAWKLPYELSFMLTTGLRFLPVLFQETAIVLTAQRLQGEGVLRWWRPDEIVPLARKTLFPILARTLRRAATLAASAESRGFGRKQRLKVTLPLPKWQKRFCLLLLFLMVLLVAFKTLSLLAFYGVYYGSWCQPLYDGMKGWL